jgi:hypothetical protein
MDALFQSNAGRPIACLERLKEAAQFLQQPHRIVSARPLQRLAGRQWAQPSYCPNQDTIEGNPGALREEAGQGLLCPFRQGWLALRWRRYVGVVGQHYTIAIHIRPHALDALKNRATSVG